MKLIAAAASNHARRGGAAKTENTDFLHHGPSRARVTYQSSVWRVAGHVRPSSPTALGDWFLGRLCATLDVCFAEGGAHVTPHSPWPLWRSPRSAISRSSSPPRSSVSFAYKSRLLGLMSVSTSCGHAAGRAHLKEMPIPEVA